MGSDSSAPHASVARLLQIEGLTKRFGSIIALDGVSLDLREGECLGLLGPNGAGKTTLIRCIMGRVSPEVGSVRLFDGRSSTAHPRIPLGWVPQELALYPRLTCSENLETFGRYFGLNAPALAAAVRWALDWSSLAEHKSQLVGKLSGGMRRRLNMAAGLLHRPKVALLDEPTIGVDPQSRNRIFEMIENMRNQGVSLIYTTHYIEEAERLCDRIAVMDHGRIVASGTTQELVSDSFGSRKYVTAQFGRNDEGVQGWVQQRGGRYIDGTAQFVVDRPAELVALLDAAAKAGHEPLDVSLRKPNLESVFLLLTGRELRE